MNFLPLEWMIRAVGGCTVVERKVELTTEWMNKTQEFIDRAFSGPPDEGVKYSCSRCRNTLRQDKRTLTLHIWKFSFMTSYEVWTHHGETVHQRTTSVAEEGGG
jgi:hypothetical protein